MNLRPLLAAPLAVFALATHTSLPAQAQDAPQQAFIKVANESSWTLDCRVTWGNINLAFNNLAPGATSDSRGMPVSGSQRTAICKKRGVTPTPLTTSAPLKFNVTDAGSLTLKCSHPGSNERLTCAISKD